MRFGLEPYTPMTLREVGENLGLTRERVRQLESQALMKLMTALGGDPMPEPWADRSRPRGGLDSNITSRSAPRRRAGSAKS